MIGALRIFVEAIHRRQRLLVQWGYRQDEDIGLIIASLKGEIVTRLGASITVTHTRWNKNLQRSHAAKLLRLLALLLLLTVGLLPQAAVFAQGEDAASRLEPTDGVYYGVTLRWDLDSLAKYRARLGHGAAVAVRFFCLPLCDGEDAALEEFISQVALENSMAMLTMEPYQGLAAVTPAVAENLALRIAAYNGAGVPIFLRFAHEMNGSWYPWCQKPEEYIAAYRLVADAVRRHAPMTALVWAPNYGGGYPFRGGTYEAKPGTDAFEILDTNDDGVLTMEDDMYAPYYPGDDVVDWVGMSLYHWGSTYPWRENEIPEAGKFHDQLRGEYNGLNGDDSAVPDFYEEYGVVRDKPIAIPETAAMYNTEISGADEVVIKQTWWRQVFSTETFSNFPQIKMINWFEVRKQETEIQNSVVNWAITQDARTLLPFKQDLPTDSLIFAGEAEGILMTYLPTIVEESVQE